MRQKSWIVMGCALALVVAMAAPALAGAGMPPADGQAFWTYISKTNPYTKWTMWPGKEGMYEGKSPHGRYLKIFVNQPALQALKAHKPMPPGAIIVKENYKDKKTLAAITPMYKVKGFNPQGGDWFWAKISDGKVLAAGKVRGCLKCHQAVQANDWIFTK